MVDLYKAVVLHLQLSLTHQMHFLIHLSSLLSVVKHCVNYAHDVGSTPRQHAYW